MSLPHLGFVSINSLLLAYTGVVITMPPTSEVTAAWLAFLTPMMVAIVAITNLWIARRAEAKLKEVASLAVQAAGRIEHKADAVATLAAATAVRVERKADTVALVAAETAARVEGKADTVAGVAAETAAQAQAQAAYISSLAEKTHTLVNSQHGMALALVYEKARLILTYSRRVYELTRSPSDFDAVNSASIEMDAARGKLMEHESRQAVVDSKEAAKARGSN